MVYIISVSSYTNEVWGDFEEERLIKIGYTNEPDGKTRFGAYRFSTRIKIFKIIEEGTEDDEKRLHKYFKKYRARGKEWYRFDEDILNFFRTYTTIEEIRAKLPLLPIEEKFTVEEIEKVKCLFNPILYYMINHNSIRLVGGDEYITIDQVHNTLLDKNILDLNSFYDFLRTRYDPVKVEEAIKWYKDFYLVQNITNDLEEFFNFSTFISRMKYLCEEVHNKLEKEKLSLFLDSIPSLFKRYYLFFGPEKLKALAYQRSKIMEEFEALISDQSVEDALTEDIYLTFSVGKSYTKEFIKTTLKELYKKHNYTRTAKANDLDKWFRLTDAKIVNKETKKRDNGFRLCNKKV